MNSTNITLDKLWSGLLAVGDDAEGDTEADDCYGGCTCCQGGETDGRCPLFALL